MTKSGDDEDLSPWPRQHRQTFEGKLQNALESDIFSTLDSKDLPMAVSRIARAARSSPKELLQESFAFSLVARNEKVFGDLLRRVTTFNFDETGIYPLHLLTSFLDGSKTCCNLLDAVMKQLSNGTFIDGYMSITAVIQYWTICSSQS